MVVNFERNQLAILSNLDSMTFNGINTLLQYDIYINPHITTIIELAKYPETDLFHIVLLHKR